MRRFWVFGVCLVTGDKERAMQRTAVIRTSEPGASGGNGEADKNKASRRVYNE